MCGSALAGLGSADGLVSRVVGRVSVVVGASVVVAQAVTSSTRATPPNHLITRPSSRTVDWSIRIGAEARRGPLPIWNLNQEPVAAVEVRRLRSCRGRGIEKDFGQIWSLADLPRPKSPRPGIKPGRGRGFQNDFGQIRSLADLPRPKSPPRSPGPSLEKDFGRIRSLADLPRPKSRPHPGQPRSPGPRYREGLRSDLVTGRPSASKVPALRHQARAGGGVSRTTSVRSGHWPTSRVQSPAPTQARSPTGGTSRRTSDGSGHWLTSHVQTRSPPPPSRASN